MSSVVLYSDFVCPFCFIAERSSLARMQREMDVQLEWRGFELHPETPPGGMRLSELFGEARAAAMRDHVRRYAAQFGIEDMRVPDHVPNTRRALAAAEYARSQGRLDAFREGVMDAYWRDGRDIEDPAVLGAIARDAGLDAREAARAGDDPGWLARVDAARSGARQDGVMGIPTFVIDGQRVVGAQPYEVLAAAARRAGAGRPG